MGIIRVLQLFLYKLNGLLHALINVLISLWMNRKYNVHISSMTTTPSSL